MTAVRIAVIVMCLVSLAVTVVLVIKKDHRQMTAAFITSLFAGANLILMALDELL